MSSAGDLERYMYCAHNWWLAKQGVDPGGEGSRRGIRDHEKKGERLEAYAPREQERRRAVQWSFIGVLALGSIGVLTVEAIFFDATAQAIILLVTGIVLVSAIIGLFSIALYEEREAKRLVREAGERHGQVIGGDLLGSAQLLEDPEWGLSGRPDYIMETDEGLIPVEVKTGKTPARPYDSHTMQVASYLRLLEVNTDQAPQYGLLTYPQRTFQVRWDEATKNRLRSVLTAMEAAEAAGKADRDHDHPGRCRGCARRDACDQRLV